MPIILLENDNTITVTVMEYYDMYTYDAVAVWLHVVQNHL